MNSEPVGGAPVRREAGRRGQRVLRARAHRLGARAPRLRPEPARLAQVVGVEAGADAAVRPLVVAAEHAAAPGRLRRDGAADAGRAEDVLEEGVGVLVHGVRPLGEQGGVVGEVEAGRPVGEAVGEAGGQAEPRVVGRAAGGLREVVEVVHVGAVGVAAVARTAASIELVIEAIALLLLLLLL